MLEEEFLTASQQVTDQEAADARRLKRARQIQRIMIGVTAVLVVAVAYLAYTFLFHKTPAVMDGFFNLAIASATQPFSGDDESAPGFAELLYGSLRSEIRDSSNLLIWRDSPELRAKNVLIGPVEGDTFAARSKAAAEMANRLNADMVIYGVEQPGPQGPQFGLEFALTPRQGYDFEDLEGSFDLGCAIPLNGQPDAFYIQSELSPCASGISFIALGLSEAQFGHSLEALEAFLEAARFFPESEIVQFLIGREYLFLVDRKSVLEFVRAEFYQQAAVAFTRATELNPDYPRAYIGLGSVYFKQARDLNLQENISPEQLDEALALIDQSLTAYQTAIEKAGDPNAAGLPVESVARQGLGNSLRQKGELLLQRNELEQAMQFFDQSIQLLEPIVQEFAQAGQERYLTQTYEYLGSAYLRKGLAFIQSQDYQSGLEAYQNALNYFDQCISQVEGSQDFIIKDNIVRGICQPNREYIQEQIAVLGGTQ